MAREFEYQGHWLAKRRDTAAWFIWWCVPGTRRVERRSSGTADLEEAKRRLIAFAESRQTPPPRSPVIVPPPGPMPNPTSPFQGPSGILPACGVEILQVLRSYKDRLAGRPSHDTAKYAIQAWTEFLSLSGFRYVHEMTLTAQERFIHWRRPSRLTGLPNSNGTINRDLEVLRAAFYDAWRRGEIAAFPHVRLLPKPAPRDRFLTESEVQRLLDECADTPHLRLFCLVALHTLQRPISILNLRVEQVDLKWNRIDFRPPGGVQTKKRRAVVPITATLRPELELAARESESGYIVEFRGAPIKRIACSFRRLAKRAGLPHATPGILRHSGATLLCARGVPVREVSGMLGHTTSRITEEVYAKRRPEFLAAAAHTLDQLFPTAPASPHPPDAA